MAKTDAEVWIVNSYGYPHFFLEDQRSKNAAKICRTFFRHNSYNHIKHELTPLSQSAVESWKAAFEEFGLFYVPYGEDRVVHLPLGRQMLDATDQNEREKFIWFAMNGLSKYRFNNPHPVRRTRFSFENSDVHPYWALWEAMRKLDNYIYWDEFSKLLATVMHWNQLPGIISSIQECRKQPKLMERYQLSNQLGTRDLQNILMQVMKHGSVAYDIITKEREVMYGKIQNKYYINPKYLHLFDEILGISMFPSECEFSNNTPFEERILRYQGPIKEVEYFEGYLGARVDTDLPHIRTIQKELRAVDLGNENVSLIEVSETIIRSGLEVQGPSSELCTLRLNQRVIVSDDLTRTYIILSKFVNLDGIVTIKLRGARRIVDADYILKQIIGK
ncbi:MAG: hypothetical protein Phog2KO_39220 [Phototrophicaceae bacterium]